MVKLVEINLPCTKRFFFSFLDRHVERRLQNPQIVICDKLETFLCRVRNEPHLYLFTFKDTEKTVDICLFCGDRFSTSVTSCLIVIRSY